MKARLVTIGGAHIDRRGRIAGPHMPEVSNPGAINEEVGGAAYNAARAAIQRGVNAALLSIRGGDIGGEAVAEAIAQAGIEDHSATFLDRRTPSYTAILTEDGNLITALADMSLYEYGFEKQLRRSRTRQMIAEADLVLIDANMPPAAIRQAVELAGSRPVHAIAVSPAKVARLRPVLAQLGCLFMNRREAFALAEISEERTVLEAAGILSAADLAAGVITSGEEPCLFFSQGVFFEIAPRPAKVVDVTGAGDALAGTAAAAIARGLVFADAVSEGMAAASLAVESDRAAPEMREETFRAAVDTIPQPLRIA